MTTDQEPVSIRCTTCGQRFVSLKLHLRHEQRGCSRYLTAAPIFVPCVGSGAVSPHHLCPMCGEPYPQGERIPEHTRQDILAMIDRGDFG